MKVLIIGSGGREDAFCWKFNGESGVEKVYVWPGNAGMNRLEKVELLSSESFEHLVKQASDLQVDLCVCGPEGPLAEGVADLFKKADISFFGPSAQAAQLEGSKIFSKEFMRKYSIPTADFEVAESFEQAQELVSKWNMEEGIVLKADGLASGKGVVVTNSLEEAQATVFDFMKDPQVSVKTDRLLLEKVLMGEEVSCFALCSKESFFFLGSACDHKRVGDGDVGANTGGMGCFRDRKWPNPSLQEKIVEKVLKPTLTGMKKEGTPFTGFLFMGLMIDKEGEPWVIEYNVRMGDPETQTLFPLLKGSLASSLKQMADGGVVKDLELIDKDSVHVVLTSGGYPSIGKHSMSLGHELNLEKLSPSTRDLEIFYAGVKAQADQLCNSGGRVLGVTALGNSIEECRLSVYREMQNIKLEASHYRKDIGLKPRGKSS